MSSQSHDDHNLSDSKSAENKYSAPLRIDLTLTQFNCASVTDFSPLCDCLYDKVFNDFYQLLNLVQPIPKSGDNSDQCDEKERGKYYGWTSQETECFKEDRSYNDKTVSRLLKESEETDPNVPIRLCKLSNSLMSFPGCNKDDYLFWKLCILYGRRLKCRGEKMVCNPFCVPEPCVDYKALCKVSTILSAIQQAPDTNITYSTGFEMITLLFKTLCADVLPQIGNILLLINIAVTGCNAVDIDGSGCAPNGQIFSNTAPVEGITTGTQTLPCGTCTGQPFAVYVAQHFELNANVVTLLSKFKIMGFLLFLAFEYLCDFTIIDCLCIETIIKQREGANYIACSFDPFASPNLWPYTPASPDPPICPPPTISFEQRMYAVNPLGDCLIKLLKRLYCAFTQSTCNSPCPTNLFEYLLKYSPEYNNDVKRLLCLKPYIKNCLKDKSTTPYEQVV
jgi:hypothetical protein